MTLAPLKLALALAAALPQDALFARLAHALQRSVGMDDRAAVSKQVEVEGFFARTPIVVLALFAAGSAIAGAVELLLWTHGNRYLPLELLEHTPFTSFSIPGLLLLGVVGGSSLACAWFVWRRSPLAIDATLLTGGALTVWIGAEIAIFRTLHWLHGVYGPLGIALLGLGIVGAQRSLHLRQRWVVTVTLAEAIGYLAPTCVGIVSTKAGIGDAARAGLLVAAGLFEGFALGLGQASMLPLPLHRLRYALLTAFGAGAVWACVMTLTLLGSATPWPLVLVAATSTAVVGLTAIGGAQWLELRQHAASAQRWIAWTALAWTVALPLSFAPAPLVDASTPVGSQLVLWGSAGLIMAYVMALITWQGVRRLGAPQTTAHPTMPQRHLSRRSHAVD